MYLHADGSGFLGTYCGPHGMGLACDPAKLAAVQNWHAPDKVKGVQQFVGFVGYYRRFVKDFADLAEPLVALTRKRAAFVWTATDGRCGFSEEWTVYVAAQ